MEALYKSCNGAPTQDAAQILPGLAVARGGRAQRHGGTSQNFSQTLALSCIFKASLISVQPCAPREVGGLSGCGNGDTPGH